MMVPDCVKRLTTAYEDLKNKLSVRIFIRSLKNRICIEFEIINFCFKDAEDLNQTEEFKEAEKLNKEAQEILAAK